MAKLKLYKYKLTTVSSLVLSPREAQAFYSIEGSFKPQHILDRLKSNIDERKVKVIYPFYQYGTYSKYDPENAQYYIPGSSIKGAIHCGGKSKAKMLVDDIQININDLELNQLCKLQRNGEKLVLDTFFPNTVFEMMKSGSEYIGQIFSDDKLKFILNDAQKLTIRKLEQLANKLRQELDSLSNKETFIKINQLLKNVIHITNEIKFSRAAEYTLLLGGYKGLMLSGVVNDLETETSSAVFVDQSTELPYGLVQIKLLENEDTV